MSNPATVYFEETGEERAIVGYCKVCRIASDDWPPPVVSPAGVVHHGADYGMTACGKDATGPRWWWRL